MAKASKCPNCKGTISLTFGKCVSDACTAGGTAVTQSRATEIVTALNALEERIKRSWVEMGRLLIEMRDGEHYRDLGHKSFAAFCEAQRYGRRRAYQLIEAVETGEEVVQFLHNPPQVESQMRALTPALKEGKRAVTEVMEAVGDKPTTGKIKREVKKRKSETAEQSELEPTYAILPPECPHPATCDLCGEKGKLA